MYFSTFSKQAAHRIAAEGEITGGIIPGPAVDLHGSRLVSLSAEYLLTDPFLSAHCVPVLYEFEPASPDKAAEGCFKSLDSCQVCGDPIRDSR